MIRRVSLVVALVVALAVALTARAEAADLKTIKTQKAKDVDVSLMSESGQWKPGKNEFILAFTRDGKPLDVSKAMLNTSMSMPGMTPMLAGATLQADGPGRYRGNISFPDSGDRQVTVSWDGPAGKGSTRFTVSVR